MCADTPHFNPRNLPVPFIPSQGPDDGQSEHQKNSYFSNIFSHIHNHHQSTLKRVIDIDVLCHGIDVVRGMVN